MKAIARISVFLVGLFVALALGQTFLRTPLGTQGSVSNLRFEVNAAGIATAVVWDYDFTKASNKPCATATQASCVTSFTVSTVQVSAPLVPVGTPATLSVFAMLPANTTGPTIGISVPYTSPTGFGNYQVGVQVNFNDAAGKVQGGVTNAISYYVGPDGVLNLRTTP